MNETLKTLLVDAHMQYLEDRGHDVFIKIDKRVLEPLDGYIDVTWATDSENINEFIFNEITILNINSIDAHDLLYADNKLFFILYFENKTIYCCVPTASIISIFNEEIGHCIDFDVKADLEAELKETAEYEKNIKVKKVKPSHLRVVKKG